MGKLCTHSVGWLTWGIPVLEPTGCWVVPGLGANYPNSASSKSSSRLTLHNISATSFNYPSHSFPHAIAPVDPQRPADRSGPDSYEVSFCTGSQFTQDLVWALQKWGLCFLRTVELLQSNPAGLQIQMFWGLLLPIPNPQAGEPDMGLMILILVELLWYNYSPDYGLPTLVCMEFDYITNTFLVPFHCGLLSLDVEYFFLVDSSFFFFHWWLFSN